MATICDISNNKAQISYPTSWKYKVVLEKTDSNLILIDTALDGTEYKISPSRTKGNYESFEITAHIIDEAHKNLVFSKLSKIAKFVL